MCVCVCGCVCGCVCVCVCVYMYMYVCMCALMEFIELHAPKDKTTHYKSHDCYFYVVLDHVIPLLPCLQTSSSWLGGWGHSRRHWRRCALV